MTPEHIEHLAALADPDELWRRPFDRFDLQQARQLEMGIALRRYAAHVRRLHELVGTSNSLLITPISHNVVQTSLWPTPEQHVRRGALTDPLGP